jgi:hypothetical protein
MVDWMKSVIMRTPLEGCAKVARMALQRVSLLKHPELREIRNEEVRIALLIGKIVGPSSNCIDAGSHLGTILSLFLKHAPRGRHLAFKPNPWQARWLTRRFPESAALSTRAAGLLDIEPIGGCCL